MHTLDSHLNLHDLHWKIASKKVLDLLTEPRTPTWLESWSRENKLDYINTVQCLAWLSVNNFAQTVYKPEGIFWEKIGDFQAVEIPVLIQSPAPKSPVAKDIYDKRYRTKKVIKAPIKICRGNADALSTCSCKGRGRGRCRHRTTGEHFLLARDALLEAFNNYRPGSNGEDFGQLLASAAEVLNTTFQAMGKRIGRSRASMYRWLHCKATPHNKVQADVCKRLLELLEC